MTPSEIAQDMKYEEDWRTYRKLVMSSLDSLQARANETDKRTRDLEVEIALLKQEQARISHQVAASESDLVAARASLGLIQQEQARLVAQVFAHDTDMSAMKSDLAMLRQEQKVFEAKSGVWGGASGAIAAGVVMALKALGLLGG